MSRPLECSDIHRWEALSETALSPEQHERYERHLESCPTCQALLDRTEDLDGGLRRLCRQLGDPTTVAPDPTLSHLLEQLHGVRSPLVPPLAGPPDLYFLRPADQPGLLGLLGDYQVREVIGQGGMGVVLKAFDPALNRLVAIKVMAAAIAGSATARRRFAREAQAAAAVCHDNVVTVHGVHEADGLPYLVMQFVPGESLQARLDRTGPLEVTEAVRIGHQTASGLAAAHAQGLIHRDIKPANLLLENGLARVKITDFGLARMTDDVGLTQAGVVSGTPEYMAPEQARGEAIDHRADLFSLGSVLYAMCTGEPPFRGSTAVAVLRRVSDETPRPIRSLNPEVPAWLETLIGRLMTRDPADRLQSAAETAELLEGYLAHLRQPVTVEAPLLPLSPRAEAKEPPPSRTLPWLRRPLWLAVGVALLALLGLSRWFLGQNAPPASQPAMVEFYHDFRGSRTPHPAFKWAGKDPDKGGVEVVEQEERGLRIRLQTSRKRKDPFGLGLEPAGVKGDFEITAGYEIPQEVHPGGGGGVGFELYLMTTTATKEAISYTRTLRPDGSIRYGYNRGTTVDGQRIFRGDTFLTTATAGRLRVTRSGKDITLAVSEGAEGPFQVLCPPLELGTDDLKLVRICAYPGFHPALTDVRFVDLRVRAESLPDNLLTSPTAGGGAGLAATEGNRPDESRGWLAAAGLVGLGLTLALVGLGVWGYARRRRRAVAPAQAEAAPLVAFACAECGKAIKARPEQAGKRGKCPQCGKMVIVPAAQTS
jgi:serine/threonine protein kinase